MLLFHAKNLWGNLKQYEGLIYKTVVRVPNWFVYDPPTHNSPRLGSQFTRVLGSIENTSNKIKAIELILYFMHPIAQGIIQDNSVDAGEIIWMCKEAGVSDFRKIDQHRVLIYKRPNEFGID